jgi:hypothetical protein
LVLGVGFGSRLARVVPILVAGISKSQDAYALRICILETILGTVGSAPGSLDLKGHWVDWVDWFDWEDPQTLPKIVQHRHISAWATTLGLACGMAYKWPKRTYCRAGAAPPAKITKIGKIAQNIPKEKTILMFASPASPTSPACLT